MNYGYSHKLVGHKDTLIMIGVVEEGLGVKLVSCSVDGNILCWDLRSHRILNKSQIPVITPQEISVCQVFSGVILLGYSEGLISKFGLDSKSLINSYKGHSDQITALSLSEKGLFSSSHDCSIRRWCLDSAQCEVIYQFSDPISYIFSTGNDLFLASWDRYVRLIDIDQGCITSEFLAADKPIQCMCTDEDRVYVGGSDLVIKSWELGTLKSVEFKGIRSWVMGLKVHGNFLIAFSDDKLISVWDKINGKLLEQFSGHLDGVTCMEIFGDKIYSGSFDQNILVWDMEEMRKRIEERSVMTREDIESRKIETFLRALNNTKKGKTNKKGKKNKKK